MKISNVSTMVMGTPWRNLLFVKVETDDGLVGWSEARPVAGVGPVIGYLEHMTPEYALGRDPFNTEDMTYRMLRETYGRAGEIAMTGIALLEIACWDIVGKALGQPVYRLLGGAVRDKIKAYANGWYRVERTPEAWYEAAKEVTDKGYLALKFDPFGSGFYEFTRKEKLLSISLVEAVYDAVGPDVELLIEMHGRFNPVTAAEIIRDLAEFRPAWVEEPVSAGEYARLAGCARGCLESGHSRCDGRTHPHALRISRIVRDGRGGYHPNRHDAFRRHYEYEKAGRHGGNLLRNGGAA